MIRVGDAAHAPSFPAAAKSLLANPQLRTNVRHATDVIRTKRAAVVAEMPDWQACGNRPADRGPRPRPPRLYLVEFEERCTEAGGHVHWPATPTRRTDVVDILRATEPRSSSGQDDDLGRDRLNGARGRRHRAVRDGSRRPDRATGAGSPLAYRRAGAPQEPARDP
jgi:hypothetical protein